MVAADPYLLLAAIGAPFVAGLLTLALPRSATGTRVLLAVAGPVATLVLVAIHVTDEGVAAATEATGRLSWVPDLHLDVSFLADGLGVFFTVLVAGIGVLVVLYARAYFGADPEALARFYPTLGFFTTAMLGIVLADHMLLTVVFWELTSISSFFLIGWNREDEQAVKAALQAFVTTGLGGLALLGGILLIGDGTGLWRWSDLLAGASDIGSGRWTVIGFLLLFVGAAAKSAQWPLHSWLPGAMAAPTPVSAYLHSATMVKAGVFLLARLLPIFGILAVWAPVLVLVGTATMGLGAVMALRSDDLKRIFAYTTVGHLGLLVVVYGLGGYGTIHLDLTQIAAHALYKAPLFLLAGAVAVQYGITRLGQLHGFARGSGLQGTALTVGWLAAAYCLAAGPGTVGFLAKEAFLRDLIDAASTRPVLWLVTGVAVGAAACNVAIAVRLAGTVRGWRHVAVEADAPPPRDAPTGRWGAMLWIPALLLLGATFVGGALTTVWNAVLRPVEGGYGLPGLWDVATSPGWPLILSAAVFAGGAALGLSGRLRGHVDDPHDRLFPGVYLATLRGGFRAFHTVQTGHLRHYLVFVFGALLVCFVWAAFADPSLVDPPDLVSPWESPTGILLGLVVCATAIALPLVAERVVRVLVLGASGFGVVGLYLLYQAPDLALTQLMFEIISVILFLLVLRLLPRPDRRPRISRAPRLALAALIGLSVGWMTLQAGTTADRRSEEAATLGAFFESHSLEGSAATDGRGGEGRNVVNVILVDFRGFDTLGEITVLATAALGVWSLLPGRRRHEDDPEPLSGAEPVR